MDWYAGIDGSLEASCVCLVDDAGKIIREGSERSECYLRHAEGEDEEFSSSTLEFATSQRKRVFALLKYNRSLFKLMPKI